jgi:hypothetical protein
MIVSIIQVNSMLHSKLELIKCVPKLKRIRQLLEQNPYRGHFDDDDDDEENPKPKVSSFIFIVESISFSFVDHNGGSKKRSTSQ